ncbi:MAG: hypothetical protein KR126chlam6_00166 [Candidatus Anoxychlamydiales bacterium]|nr:hypothetical protein [Candidatus Anoxychlamydiales bacterium]
MKQKSQETLELTIHDALSNLSTLADMQIDINEPIGIVKKNKLVMEEDTFDYKTIDWLIKQNAQDLIDKVKETYLVLLNYLQNIYEKDFIDYDDPKCRKGFQAIMVMAMEAANKVDQYIELLPQQNLGKIVDTNEYKELKSFYLDSIAKKFKEALEGDEPWIDEWHHNEKSLLLDIERSGLKDFESLKKDEKYELFYLVDEEEKPFFDHELIRNIKLFCSFDEGLKDIEDDPLLKIRVFLDKDFQMSARQILYKSKEVIDTYFKGKYQKEIGSEMVSLINEAIFSLQLAANEHNLITHSFFKNSIEYFHDFQGFLRDVFASDEYQKIIAYDLEDKRSKSILELVYTLCTNLFIKVSCIKQEIIGFIHMLIRKGDEMRKFKYPQKASFWNVLLENDESIQALLSSYPNGPLMKILDVIRFEEFIQFDPLMQDNRALKLYEIKHKQNELQVIRCPSPTKQHIITHAEVVEEFKAFIRSLKKDQKYLFINLQDKNSYTDGARCKAIERMQKRADFKDNIVVISLDKNSDFYHQVGIYLHINEAKDFKKTFKQQLFSKESSFSLVLSDKLNQFIDKAFESIHKHFFVNKNIFTRKNRLDFIEIFYNLLTLKLIELNNPQVMSFTCKDGIDSGALSACSFYAFLKMITNENLTKENEDYIRWLLYSSAILVRERSINPTGLTRVISALNSMDIEMLARSKIMKEISTLYDASFLKSLKITEN